MTKKMIIEARINEYAMRDDNPHVPWTADEIAETAARCREEGASIVHFHARNPDGSPLHGVDAYAEIIRKIRSRSDILVHPTLGWFANDDDPAGRIACVTTLACDPATRPDFAPIDTGSVNLESYDAESRSFHHGERVYINRTTTLELYARDFKRSGIKPQLVTWAVGFTRRAAAMIEMGLVDEPAWFLVNMTEGACLTGHPGTAAGLKAHLAFLPANRKVEWASNVVGGNLLELADTTARLGGHLAPGIGDHPYLELGCPRNEEVVRMAVRTARAAGREIASPQETREMLGLA
ncbi:3-keto-5-aminohexanoate cleavage protein [Piscinibacter sakaiensis]|uniref:3-keto-5-aminohexanoate cleavage protein n=1 Tax=Piscinibacter sakaiensis TaxID=1547922 RepID=UPI003AAEAFA9